MDMMNMKDNSGSLIDPVRCPFCGAEFTDSHSCQDNPQNEYARMMVDRTGMCPCDAQEQVNNMMEWGGLFDPSEIVLDE